MQASKPSAPTACVNPSNPEEIDMAKAQEKIEELQKLQPAAKK